MPGRRDRWHKPRTLHRLHGGLMMNSSNRLRTSLAPKHVVFAALVGAVSFASACSSETTPAPAPDGGGATGGSGNGGKAGLSGASGSAGKAGSNAGGAAGGGGA